MPIDISPYRPLSARLRLKLYFPGSRTSWFLRRFCQGKTVEGGESKLPSCLWILRASSAAVAEGSSDDSIGGGDSIGSSDNDNNGYG